jgi:hypothetical protein
VSGPAKMTASQYLTARGWIDCGGKWTDPRLAGTPIESSPWFSGDVHADAALTIQRARDAEEEHRAWVAFAAAFCPVVKATQTGDETIEQTQARGLAILADAADRVLDAYRARFAVEVES